MKSSETSLTKLKPIYSKTKNKNLQLTSSKIQRMITAIRFRTLIHSKSQSSKSNIRAITSQLTPLSTQSNVANNSIRWLTWSAQHQVTQASAPIWSQTSTFINSSQTKNKVYSPNVQRIKPRKNHLLLTTITFKMSTSFLNWPKRCWKASKKSQNCLKDKLQDFAVMESTQRVTMKSTLTARLTTRKSVDHEQRKHWLNRIQARSRLTTVLQKNNRTGLAKDIQILLLNLGFPLSNRSLLRRQLMKKYTLNKSE
jgi:hypothetical protein